MNLFKKIYLGIPILLLFIISPLKAQVPPETAYGVPVDPSDVPMPGYLQPIQDLDYAVDITRLSDIQVFSNYYGAPLSAGSIRHQYAKIQAWNADMSLLHFGTVFFLNGNDYTIYKMITWAGLNDGRWSNVDPNIFYFCDGSDFKKINVVTEQVTLLHTFPTYVHAGIGPWEGNLSADDRYVIITDYDANGAGIEATVYDIVNDVTMGTHSGNFDWASMTPSGDYVVLSNNATGQLERYDLNFQNMFVLVNDQQHGDFAVNVNGEEVWVQVIPLSMTRLSDGQFTDLLPATASTSGTCGYPNYNPNIAGHVSGRNFDMPGWAVVSANIHPCANGMGYDWHSEVYAVKLDYSGLGTIRNYGNSRTSVDYTIATVSPDGQKILFFSDWNVYGQGGADVLSYLVQYNPALPVEWLSPLKAEIVKNQTLLTWRVAQQDVNEKFIVERSMDGYSFEPLGEIKAEPAPAIYQYHFMDKNPLSGDNFYRLKQVDKNGQYEYSDIARIYFQKNAISIYPVPGKADIFVHLTRDDAYELYNQFGMIVKKGWLLAGENTLDLSGLHQGVYFLKTASGEVGKIVLSAH